MKVLFMSLSRIGDFFQHCQLINNYLIENPYDEIHVLTNDLVGKEKFLLLPKVKFWILPRFQYQQWSNLESVPLLMPYWHLKQLLTNLRDQNFTKVYDLSLQTSSRKLLKIIKPNNTFEAWQVKLINEQASGLDPIPNLEFLGQLYKTNVIPHPARNLNKVERIIFQLASQDLKKQIDLVKWDQLILRIESLFPDKKIVVLSAKSEFKIFSRIFGNRVWLCDFTQIMDLFLLSNSLLISVDTSIKHLATHFRIPTVEVAIGGSHPIENIGYQTGNIILESKDDCYPCFHSSACSFGRNKCQDSVSLEKIIEILQVISGEKCLSEQFSMTQFVNNKLTISGGKKWKRKTSKINIHPTI